MAIWLLALVVVSVFWILHYRQKFDRAAGTLLAERSPRYSHRRGRAREVAVLMLALTTVASLGLAMMRPQIESQHRTAVFERRDLVLLLDRSVSMRARDVAPSRAARAMQEVQRFLRAKPDVIDRVALIGFAGSAVVLSYPTDDVDSLSFYLDWAQADETPQFGTNIAAALATALEMVRREPVRVPPVFVLISDGDDQSGRLDSAAAAVLRAGIHIHCIGIGSNAPAAMPVPVGDGREEFLRDDEGQLVTTRFADATLQRLAALTGGQYFRSITGGELLLALNTIAVDQRRQIGWQTARAPRDTYRAWLAAAAVATVGLLMLL